MDVVYPDNIDLSEGDEMDVVYPDEIDLYEKKVIGCCVSR